MKKSWITFICILLCVLIPALAVISAALFIPVQFDRTFLGELKDKVERLYSTDEPKIVVIGGSSVPFGVDSVLMEEMLGMPVVNFGLYATLGTKLMLDLSRKAIGKGDVIVIAPETDAQTYSLYFNAEATWQACDGNFSTLTKISSDNFPDMLGGVWKFAAQKIKYATAEEHLDPSGIYNKASFNEYGDISAERPYNIMPVGFDSTMKINISPEIISEDFIDYVNDYVKFAEKKGARVLFSFAPMNENALDESLTMDDLRAFSAFIDERFNAERISDPNGYIYRGGYFYDSNFHLCSAGMIMHTANLAGDIAKALDIPLLKTVEIPPEPQVPDTPDDKPTFDYDENEKYFVFEEITGKGEIIGYRIVGVSDAGKAQSVLHTATAYNSLPVLEFAPHVFDGCDTLSELYISAAEKIESISLQNGVFSGADNLKKIHVTEENPERIKVDSTVDDPFKGLCEGMNRSAMICVPKAAYDAYLTNYFWSTYVEHGVVAAE